MEEFKIKSEIKLNNLLIGCNKDKQKLFNGYVGQINIYHKKLNSN